MTSVPNVLDATLVRQFVTKLLNLISRIVILFKLKLKYCMAGKFEWFASTSAAKLDHCEFPWILVLLSRTIERTHVLAPKEVIEKTTKNKFEYPKLVEIINSFN